MSLLYRGKSVSKTLPRITILRILIAIGGVGVALAIVRWSALVGTYFGLTVLLAMIRTAAAIDRAGASGVRLSRGRKANALVGSIVAMGVLILMTGIVFLIGSSAVFLLAPEVFTTVLKITTMAVVVFVVAMACSVSLTWEVGRKLAVVMWPCDLTEPEDGFWTLPAFADGSLEPPPVGRREAEGKAVSFDRLPETEGIDGITGGRSETGET